MDERNHRSPEGSTGEEGEKESRGWDLSNEFREELRRDLQKETREQSHRGRGTELAWVEGQRKVRRSSAGEDPFLEGSLRLSADERRSVTGQSGGIEGTWVLEGMALQIDPPFQISILCHFPSHQLKHLDPFSRLPPFSIFNQPTFKLLFDSFTIFL